MWIASAKSHYYTLLCTYMDTFFGPASDSSFIIAFSFWTETGKKKQKMHIKIYMSGFHSGLSVEEVKVPIIF